MDQTRGEVLGLIPAHAGKTATDPYSRETLAAHPRSRGENGYDQLAEAAGNGSSPLTRGKPDLREVRGTLARLIPAHAGKTPCRGGRTPPRTAHPRSRGENSRRATVFIVMSGSSPLTRGKPRPTSPRYGTPRLIPAHAGKTLPSRPPYPRMPAHPRSRGENVTS